MPSIWSRSKPNWPIVGGPPRPSGERPGFGKRAGDYVAQVVEDRTNNQLADNLDVTATAIRRALALIDEGALRPLSILRGTHRRGPTAGRALGLALYALPVGRRTERPGRSDGPRR